MRRHTIFHILLGGRTWILLIKRGLKIENMVVDMVVCHTYAIII